MPAKGQKVSEETRRKMSEARKKIYEDPEERRKQSERISALSHGMVRTGAYNSWYAMKQRCSNPRHKGWKYYGARGIGFDPRWVKFEAFHADMGDRPEGMTLDRIDYDKDYGPGNCRWATWREQRKNQIREKDPIRWLAERSKL
jgi:hypothetical protein